MLYICKKGLESCKNKDKLSLNISIDLYSFINFKKNYQIYYNNVRPMALLVFFEKFYNLSYSMFKVLAFLQYL